MFFVKNIQCKCVPLENSEQLSSITNTGFKKSASFNAKYKIIPFLITKQKQHVSKPSNSYTYEYFDIEHFCLPLKYFYFILLLF